MTPGGQPTTNHGSADDRRQTGSAFLLRLGRDEPIAHAAGRVLSALTDEMLRYLATAEEVGVDVAIHETRRRGKQARAFLRLVRSAIGDEFGELDRRYQAAGRLLATARDARIVLEAFAEMFVEGDEAVRSALIERANAEEALLFTGADRAVDEVEHTLREAAEQVSELRVGEDSSAIIEGATASYAAGREAGRVASLSRSPEDFHRWRKRAKDFRHQIAFVWDCEPLAPEDHDRLYELSDLLGVAHDLVVVREHLIEVSTASASDLLKAVDDRREVLEGEALALGPQMYARSPDDFRQRFSTRWNEWHSTK